MTSFHSSSKKLRLCLFHGPPTLNRRLPDFGSSARLVLLSRFNITQKMLNKYFNNSMTLLLFTCRKMLMNMVYSGSRKDRSSFLMSFRWPPFRQVQVPSTHRGETSLLRNL